MKRLAWLMVVMVIASTMAAGCGDDGADDTTTSSSQEVATGGHPATGDIPATGGHPDITGTWQAALAPVSVSGSCPQTPAQSGTAEVSGGDGTYTLTLSGGFICEPAGTCDFDCTAAGNILACSNAGVADDEGGVYSSALELQFTAIDAASGTNNSSYVHPDGFQCSWVADLSLTR